jgi:hypothetical protein
MRATCQILSLEMPHKDDPDIVRLRVKMFAPDRSVIEDGVECRLLRSHGAFRENLNLLVPVAFQGQSVILDLSDEGEILSVAVGRPPWAWPTRP